MSKANYPSSVIAKNSMTISAIYRMTIALVIGGGQNSKTCMSPLTNSHAHTSSAIGLAPFHPAKIGSALASGMSPESLMEADGADEIYNQLKALYQVYESLLWTSDNNFREFETSAS